MNIIESKTRVSEIQSKPTIPSESSMRCPHTYRSYLGSGQRGVKELQDTSVASNGRRLGTTLYHILYIHHNIYLARLYISIIFIIVIELPGDGGIDCVISQSVLFGY